MKGLALRVLTYLGNVFFRQIGQDQVLNGMQGERWEGVEAGRP